MISRQKKQEIINNLVEKLSRQKIVIFFDYTGLTVNKFRGLRNKLREKGIDCQVIKKTLTNLALNKAGFKNIKIKDLSGQLALILGYQDEILPAKILNNFTKENESVKILAGIVRDEYLDKEAIISLAKLPSRQELLAKLVGSISHPLRGLINACQWNLRKLIFVLKALKQEV